MEHCKRRRRILIVVYHLSTFPDKVYNVYYFNILYSLKYNEIKYSKAYKLITMDREQSIIRWHIIKGVKVTFSMCLK